ncbi:MAG TPA: medium chain dehydrogenase/reductase family protein [Nitrososphaeraceae archaeon]|nr:medium chain dehydrogenase/reductase family protein [Nitrososphaeraceae archaeon]
MNSKRVIISKFGGAENLRLIEEVIPEPRADEVRIKILTAGVSLADILMREGVHPESLLRRTPFSLGWDIVGAVDKLGDKVSSTNRWTIGHTVAALPIVGGYAQYICLPSSQLVSVPSDLDPAEAVSMVLNYTTAYQMLHRCARIKFGERILVHGAAGGVGTALLQLGKLAGLEMYGTCSHSKEKVVTDLGAKPIDYKSVDFVQEVLRLAEGGVDAVFDGIGTKSLLRSYKTLRNRGRLVGYGFGSMTKVRRHQRYQIISNILNWVNVFALNLLPYRRKVIPYSIQTLKRRRPDWFRDDLTLLLNLLKQGKIKPIIASRMPLDEAAKAHELLEKGAVTGKIVLICNL